ncbi:MAG: DUF6249 domain-containing protein [Bacteroidaceae bacterium]|nr:DUF6249 domain-containing protein [Bacteroidaceae bacterium]
MKQLVVILSLIMGIGMQTYAAKVNNSAAGAKAENAEQQLVSDSANVDSNAVRLAELKLRELEMTQQHERQMKEMEPKFWDEDILIPIFVSAIMPMGIVFIVFFFIRKGSADRNKLLALMVEKGQDVSAYIEAEKKKTDKASGKETTFIWGLVLALVGLGFTIFILSKGGESSDGLGFSLPVLGVGVALMVGALIARKWRKADEKEMNKLNVLDKAEVE